MVRTKIQSCGKIQSNVSACKMLGYRAFLTFLSLKI
jgi:hypothetical protein